MFNAHSYAISIEKLLNVPAGSADAIERNPLEYMKGFLDKEYDKSEEKATLIDEFDEKYGKYKDMRLGEWSEADAAQMVKDLREILAR